MKLSKYKIAVIGLIIANVIWGASAPIFKWSMESISPMTLGFLRFTLASLFILPFVIHRIRVQPKDLLKLFFLAFIGFGVNIGLTLIGLKLAPSMNAPVIGSSAPIFLVIGSLFFLKEKTKAKTLIGTLVSLIGVLIIVLQPILKEGFDGMVLGNTFFLLSTFAFIAYTLLLKKFDLPYHPLTITFWLFAFASVCFLAFIPFENNPSHFVTVFDYKALIGVMFGSVFTSTIAYGLYNYAIKLISTNEVGVFLYVDPVIAALIAIPLLHETMTLTFLFGTVLVFLGIFVAEGRFHYHPLHKLRG